MNNKPIKAIKVRGQSIGHSRINRRSTYYCLPADAYDQIVAQMSRPVRAHWTGSVIKDMEMALCSIGIEGKKGRI